MGTIAQNDLYNLIGDANARGERVVVATVAHTRGSTPQRRGAKMLFFENGKTAATSAAAGLQAQGGPKHAKQCDRESRPCITSPLPRMEAGKKGWIAVGRWI